MRYHEMADRLRETLAGKLIGKEDEEYEAERKVFNGMIDRHPLWIAKCAGEEDVAACVGFARDNGLPLSVRCGGHNAAGLGVCDYGLVIDLSRMNVIEMNTEARTVMVQGGCTIADMDAATHPFGLAVPSGIFSSTGIGGLTLGGGLGYLTRHYGLSIDNLLGADVVLADGSIVKASAEEHPDLFWALRGGGGNFGVVTAFYFRLQPVSTVFGGPMLWTMDEAGEVMRWFADLMAAAPDELNGFFAFLTVPPAPPFPEHLHLQNMCGIVWCYSGPMEKAESIFESIRRFRKPAADFAGPIPFITLQSMFDQMVPRGSQMYWKADFVHELTAAAIDRHLHHARLRPSWMSTMHLYPVNGAAARLAPDATAWAHRDALFSSVILGMDTHPQSREVLGLDSDPRSSDVLVKWARDYWSDLHPFSAGAGYINFMMDEGEDPVRASYGKNYDRLVAVKNRYDPDNLFRINQNIRPAERIS